MLRILLCLLLSGVLFSCETLDNTRSTQEAVQAVSEMYACPFYFITSIEYDKAKIEVTPECSFKSDYQKGKLVLDLFKALKKNGAYFDIITLKSKDEDSLDFKIKGASLKKIFKKESEAMIHLKWLKYLDTIQFMNQLDTEFKPEFTTEKSIYFSNTLFQNPKAKIDFNGFILENVQGKKYLRFQINIGNKRVLISYLLKRKKAKITSFEIV